MDIILSDIHKVWHLNFILQQLLLFLTFLIKIFLITLQTISSNNFILNFMFFSIFLCGGTFWCYNYNLFLSGIIYNRSIFIVNCLIIRVISHIPSKFFPLYPPNSVTLAGITSSFKTCDNFPNFFQPIYGFKKGQISFLIITKKNIDFLTLALILPHKHLDLVRVKIEYYSIFLNPYIKKNILYKFDNKLPFFYYLQYHLIPP